MTNQSAILVYGDLRTDRLWRASLNVLAKARTFAKEAGATVAVLLMGVSEPDKGTPQALDLSACIDQETAAGQAAASGADTVYCLEHPQIAGASR